MAKKGNKIAKIIAFSMLFVIPLLVAYIFAPTKNAKRIAKTLQNPQIFYPKIIDKTTEDGSVVRDTVYHTIPSFAVETQFGDTLTNADLLGKIHIADFFFASCPGICPIMVKQMDRVQAAFLREKEVQIVSFSVDPDRDTLTALREYAKQNKVIPGKWYLVRGNKKDIYQLARKGYFVTAEEGETPGEFNHSDKFILVDKLGRIRGYYTGTDSVDVNKLMKDIILLQKEES